MIEIAERRGELKPGMTIIEPTSGNTGIGLAIAAAVKGYKLICCIPVKMSPMKIQMIESLGGEVVWTPMVSEDHPDSYMNMAARL
jgi:cystathionine beta-synthase